MPSPKSVAFLPLGVGVESDIADVVLPVGKALEVENGFFLKTGENARRYGGIGMSMVNVGGAAIPQPYALTNHGDALVSLALPGPNPLSVWSPTGSAWGTDVDSSLLPPIATGRRGPLKSTRTQVTGEGRNPSFAYAAGYIFSGWQTLSSASTIINNQAVIDATTNERLFFRAFDTGITAQSIAQLVVTVGSTYAVFVYVTAATVTFAKYTIANLAAGPATIAFATGAIRGSTRDLDAISDGTLVRAVYRDGAGNVAGVDFNPATLATTGWTFTDATAAAAPIFNVVGWMTDLGASGKLAILTGDFAQGVRVQWDVPAAGAARQAANTYVMAAGAVNTRRIMGYTRTAAAGGEFTVAGTEGTPTLPRTDDFTNIYQRIGGVISTSAVNYRSASLASKPWTYAGDYYAMVAFLGSIDQATYYVVRMPSSASPLTVPAPLAIIAPGAAEWATAAGSFCTVANPSTGKFVMGAAVGIRLAGGGISTAVIASDMVTIEHSRIGVNDGLGTPAQALGCLFVPGGSLGQFDGAVYAEAGFAYGPETLTPTANAAAGGLTPGQKYYWATVYAYPDGQGNLWRSKPSIIASRTIGAETSQDVKSPTLRLTGRSGVIIEWYRGAANVATFLNKVGQAPNDPTVDTVTFLDKMGDTTAASQEPLYTNGGVLRNDTLPSALCVLASKDRVFVVSSDDPTEIWPSMPIVPGEGLRFSEDTIIKIDGNFGGMTGISDVDDKVVPFKANAVYAFNGDGPDVLGRGSFSEPQIVARGVGTTNPKSLVSTRDGVLFQTGSVRPVIEMLDRSLAIARPDGNSVGAAVQRYPETIVAGVLVAKQNQARFYAATGRTLVLDLVSGMWTTYTGQNAQSATIWSGAAVYATPSVAVVREDDTGATYTEAGVTYARRIASPWVAAAGIEGFSHALAIQGLGQTVGDHSMAVTLFQNYDDADVAGTKTYAMTVAGRPRWNWELVPRYRRSEAFKVVLVETATTAGAKINGVAFEVAVRRGIARRREADRV